MNGSFRHSWFFLGSIALVTLAGCARERTPAQSPGRSETFESRAPEAAQGEAGQGYEHRLPESSQGMESGGMHHHDMGTADPLQQGQRGTGQGQLGADQGQLGTGQGQLGSGQGQLGTGQGQLGSGQGQTGAGQGQTGAGQGQTGTGQLGTDVPAEVMTEQQLCSQLALGSDVQVQDTENGARIVVRPKSGGDLAAVRETAQRIEQRMQPTASSAPRGDIASQCALFDVAQLGARASIQERPNELHLILTTSDTKHVNAIRRRVREFVSTSSRQQQQSGGQQQQSGGQQQ